MCHPTSIPFIATFTEILSRKGTGNIVNHMEVMLNVIINQVNSLFGVHLTIKHYIFTIQTSENNNSVLSEMLLESHQLGHSPTARQVYTGRLE
jgi:hypothetical protein